MRRPTGCEAARAVTRGRKRGRSERSLSVLFFYEDVPGQWLVRNHFPDGERLVSRLEIRSGPIGSFNRDLERKNRFSKTTSLNPTLF